MYVPQVGLAAALDVWALTRQLREAHFDRFRRLAVAVKCWARQLGDGRSSDFAAFDPDHLHKAEATAWNFLWLSWWLCLGVVGIQGGLVAGDLCVVAFGFAAFSWESKLPYQR